MKDGDQYVNLGQVESGLTIDRNILKLQYTRGQTCPDGKRHTSTTINLQCDKDKVVRNTTKQFVVIADSVSYYVQVQLEQSWHCLCRIARLVDSVMTQVLFCPRIPGLP